MIGRMSLLNFTVAPKPGMAHTNSTSNACTRAESISRYDIARGLKPSGYRPVQSTQSMLRACLILLAVFAPAFSQKKPVTLEIAARPPQPSDAVGSPVWAPDGNSFVYTTGKALWLYDIARAEKRRLGSLEPLEKAAVQTAGESPFAWENRRVREQGLQWMPNGKSLLISAGGDLFLWPLDSAKWEQLTATAEAERDPKLSPDGRMISFVRSSEIHVLDRETKQTRRLTHDSTDTIWNGRLDWVYPEELDLGTAHWWSPDSGRIAFLQFDVGREWIYPHAGLLDRKAVYEPQRYPKAGTPNPDVRLGFVQASGGPVVWASLGDPRTSLLARVDWLPDSKRVVVQRLNRVQNELTLNLADAASGESQTVLTERDRYWINLSDDLRLLKKENAFVWSSEQSGFRHIYLYSYEGKRLKQLTGGDWEVKSVAGVDEDRGVVYYVSRERGPLGADLYSVSLRGGRRTLITPEKGLHSVSISPNARYFVDTFSSLVLPPRKRLYDTSGKQITVLQPPHPATEEYQFIRPEILPVKTSDGAVLYARLLRPANFDQAKKYPAIVMVYGGPHAQTVCECYAGMNWDQALAQRGFVVWQLDNRGTAGRGHAFETKLYRRFGKQELADQQEGIRHLLSLGFVDPRRIGMHGWSYGGFMTLYTLLNAPDLIRAGIAGAPVTDWRNYDTIYTERYLGLPQDNEEGYRLSSPIHNAANLNASLMLVHNYGDDNVLFQQSFQMMVELQKAGKMYESLLYPQRTHGVTGQIRKHMLESMTAFFERNLTGTAPVQ
jgi:dipeptidyl-peptidase 4